MPLHTHEKLDYAARIRYRLLGCRYELEEAIQEAGAQHSNTGLQAELERAFNAVVAALFSLQRGT